MAKKPTAFGNQSEEPIDVTPAPDATPEPEAKPAPAGDVRGRIVDALMELAGERAWDDFGIPEVAERAGVSLGEFRDLFPSKGAVLSAFTRKIDKVVLDGTGTDLIDEPAKERLFDVLMRRLDALQPYRNGVEGISDWLASEPVAAAAMNGVMVNSMRFMLVAAAIDVEGPVGMVKTQGLALAWRRVLKVWFRDTDSGLAETMAALDKELLRGDQIINRVEDIHRLTSPLRTLARAMFDSRRSLRERVRERWPRRGRRDETADDEETPRSRRAR